MHFGLGYLGRVGRKIHSLPAGSAALRSFGSAAIAFVGSFSGGPVFSIAGTATVSFVGSGGSGVGYQLSLYDLSDFRNLMVL